MALARLISRGQAGLEAYEVSVEVHIAGGLPTFTITGLPTAAVRESRDRVRAALHTCGVPVPSRRVTVHLGPADIPKDGGRFDLAIALGIVRAEHNKKWDTAQVEFVGELSLAGELRGISGIVPVALAARTPGPRLVIPQANGQEAALVPGAHVVTAATLREVLDDLDGGTRLSAPPMAAAGTASDDRSHAHPDRSLDDVRGHEIAKRALMIAASGNHNLLMVGPPGSGKSMLAERLPGILPPLTETEQLDVASIASVAGIGELDRLDRRRPFRAPHHTTPATSLIGGGVRPRPGEVSLAHHGVLFLDELPEFSRTALEALREPLESGTARISRLQRQTRYPARFLLIGAMNPCPCGYSGDGTDRCSCTPGQLHQYRQRLSGPLLDRFDLHIAVERQAFDELASAPTAHAHSDVANRIAAARQLQIDQRGRLNAEFDGPELWDGGHLDPAAKRLLATAESRWHLSTRSLVRIMRVARTIADLEQAATTTADHVAEALQLRRFDRPLRIDGL